MDSNQLNAYAETFNRNGHLTLQNILPEELAQNLLAEFNSLDWVLQVKDYHQKNLFEIPLSEVSNPDNLVEAIYSHKNELDLNHLFYIRLAVAKEKLSTDGMVQTIALLNSEGLIKAVKQITGIDDISYAWVEATCYVKSCFLASHLDDHPPENRVAFVLNMTKEWSLDWGGLLTIQSNPLAQPTILSPSWNSFHMFRIPINHYVSCVSQAATQKRYSITGWFRP